MHRKIVPNSDVSDEHTEHVTGPHRVLVADADADTRTLYELALPIAGCEVVQAGDGRDALTQALTETPTLIITELRLPLIGGIELCEIIRRDAATHSVPILVVTSETRPTELIAYGELARTPCSSSRHCPTLSSTKCRIC